MLTRITEEAFERILYYSGNAAAIDLRDATFVDPYGMISILELGEYACSKRIKKNLYLPESEDILKYLERMDFFPFAERVFELTPAKPIIQGKFLRSVDTDVLLEITPIVKSDDIHFVVGKVRERSHSILARHLHYDEHAINPKSAVDLK